MKNIFRNFDLVPENEKGYVTELEEEFNISLPPVFKAFCQTFFLKSIRPSDSHYLLYQDEEVGFEAFEQSIEELISVYLEQGEYYQQSKMLPIATSGIHSGGICVGLDGASKDKIFVNNEVYANRFQLISDNILDFTTKLYEVHFDDI